jgi:hypothetical protein
MAVNKNFVVKNGLEVGNDLIVADADLNRIGIGLTVPQYNLHVSGGIAATTFYVIGNISAGGTTGTTGSLLRIGDSGVEWTPTPGTRTSQVFTATANQTIFNFTHTVGLVDVFINGVKLTTSEYLDGATTITLLTPAFAGDIVELIGYTIYGVGAGVSGISGLTILEEGSVTGAPTAVTSLNFVGADITAAGTGAGVTVTVIPSRWNIGSGSSIYKLGYVGIGTTNPTTDLSVFGNTHLVGEVSVKSQYNDGVKIFANDRKISSGIITTNQLYVSGDSYLTLNLTTKVSDTVPTGSQAITLLDPAVQAAQSADKLSIAGIFNQVSITGVGTTAASPFNQTFLTTSLSTSVGAGSTLIGLASSTGISIGSSLSISGIFNNVSVQYITTVLTDDGIKPAVQIRPSDVYGFVISVGTPVGFSSVVGYRSAVFIGAGNTHNGPIPVNTDATIERIVTPNFPLEVGSVGASGTSLLVNGNARITGILTVGTASITIDGDTNTITVPNLVVTNSTTGVTASGVGITVRDGGGDLGSASVIDFGNNLTVSFASGIATITGAAGGGGSSQWVSTAAGIHTLSNVGLGTTNPTSKLSVTGDVNVTGVITATSFSGSNTLKTRTTVSGATTSIGNSSIGNINITGFKSYALMKVGLSTEGWLRLYTDSASRSADASRSVGIDPSPGSGVIAEVVTTGISTTQIISPFVMGGNLDDPASTTIYAAVTNLSGVTTSISVNLTLLQLEA